MQVCEYNHISITRERSFRRRAGKRIVNVEMNPLLQASTSHKPCRDRHFVTWSEQEDNILREQVGIHGTERWALIACQLKDKTSRQCRRRWYTYLSTAYKKGGWSPEEDRILFEAHKKFGNRWTEIAKVVQGRTDNAVKNRFSALHKKQAKREASSKENNGYVGDNEKNKRIMVEDQRSINALCNSAGSSKKMRTQLVSPLDGTMLQNGMHAIRNRSTAGALLGDGSIKLGTKVEGTESTLQSRAALAVLPHENLANTGLLGSLGHASLYHNFVGTKRPVGQGSKLSCSFLEKDDPRLSALTQQAELLSSLVQRRSVEVANQELQSAWKAPDGILAQGKEGQLIIQDQVKIQMTGSDPTTNTTKTVLSKGNCQTATCLPSNRLLMPALPNLCESCEKPSQESSEFSLGSTNQTDSDDKSKHNLPKTQTSALVCENKSFQTSSANTEEKEQVPVSSEDGYSCTTAVRQVSSKLIEEKEDERPVSFSSVIEYCSPMQVTPFFRSFVDGIPSPQFSDSERQFLLSALDLSCEIPVLESHLPSRRSSPSCRASLSNRL